MATQEQALADVDFRESLSGTAYRDMLSTDPVELIEFGDEAGIFVEYDGDTYYRDSTEGYAVLGATQLRVIANELDNRNGVPVQSEAAEDDGTYSIRGLSRRQLLAITQLVGRSTGDEGNEDVLLACISALGYEATLEGFTEAQHECDSAFPDFVVSAEF